MRDQYAGRISVIVSTYNWPEALRAVLYALSYQTDRNFEVIVAEDGTDPRTRAVVDQHRRNGLNLDHVWQEHQGFRLAAIRNRAVLAASGSYLIFLDGDCIPREHFVESHRKLAERGYFVCGNRVLLKRRATEAALKDGAVTPEDWGALRWLGARVAGQVNRISGLMRLPLGSLRRRVAQTWKRAMGCNMAMWRQDCVTVDGFDSAYVSWGWEDNDMFLRLLRAGIKRKTGRFATGVIHLWHEPPYTADNRRLFGETLDSDRTVARRGLQAAQKRFEVLNGHEAALAAQQAALQDARDLGEIPL